MVLIYYHQIIDQCIYYRFKYVLSYEKRIRLSRPVALLIRLSLIADPEQLCMDNMDSETHTQRNPKEECTNIIL